VTAAASVSIFKPEFGDFLYAAIGVDSNEIPLTVLSALSRLDFDPWEEAAELCELPKDTAAQRLASLIARLPGGRGAQDAKAIADRLLDQWQKNAPWPQSCWIMNRRTSKPAAGAAMNAMRTSSTLRTCSGSRYRCRIGVQSRASRVELGTVFASESFCGRSHSPDFATRSPDRCLCNIGHWIERAVIRCEQICTVVARSKV
jgi:hypothetical protein